MNKPVVFLKSHVDTFTRKDGAVVQAHDTKVQAKAAPLAHRQIAEAATYSAGRHEEHSVTHTDSHSSRSIRVPDSDKAQALDHARDAFAVAGLKHKGGDALSGADQYESATHTGEISHDNGVMHVSVKAKAQAKAAAPDTKTKNEGRGFHGAAMDSHRHEKHGVDGDAGSEAEHRAQYQAGDHAFSNAAHALVGAGHFANHDQARDYLDSTHGRHLGDEVGHKGDVTKPKWLAGSVKAFKKDNPAAVSGVHHGDLREGDEIEGPDGERHEFSHVEQGIGRKVVHTAAGFKHPTERDGTLAGFKKTGTNFADPAPARQRRGSAPIQQKGAPPVEGVAQKTPAEKVAAKRTELAARKPAAAAKSKVQKQGEDIGAGSWSKGHNVKIHAPGHELHGKEGVITGPDPKAPGRVVLRHNDGTGHSVHGSDLRPAAGHSWPQ